jgi:multidrug efflux pump subunit AcrA (membrane-fusion protein)
VTLGTGEHSRRWWAGIIGAIGFFAVGLAFMPGLLSSTPAPTPVFDEADAAQPHSPFRATPAALDTPSREALKASGPIAVATGSTHAFDCMIAPNEMIDIGSSITGVIESISVERSSYVEAGQVLARLESRVEEAAVLVAKARAERTVELESTRANLELGRNRRSRARDLYEGNTLSLDVREEVETEAVLAALGVKEAEENHRLAKLQLQQAEAALDRRTIRSPISGVVVERLMAAGEVVDEETILRIAQIDPLRVASPRSPSSTR